MSNIKDRQTFFKYAPTANPAEGYSTVFVDPTDDLIKVRDHLGDIRESVEQIDADIVWTVGENGDFTTINEALKEASKKNISYDKEQLRIQLLLASGFVMEEQVTVVGKDLSYVIIQSDAEVITVDRSSITDVFEDQKAVFNVKNGKLPRIDCSFEMDESGTADNQNGVFGLNGTIIFEDENSFNNCTGSNVTARGGSLFARNCEFNDALVGDGCDIGRTAKAYLEGTTTSGNNRDGVACDTSALVECRDATSQNNGRYGYASFNAGIMSIPFSTVSGNGSKDVYIDKGIVSDDTYLNIDSLKSENADFGHVSTQSFLTETTLSLSDKQILTKANATLSESVEITTTDTTSTITVDNHKGGGAIFEDGDYVRLRTLNRLNDGLLIKSIWGTVSSHQDNNNGTQSWTVTIEHPSNRGNNLTVFAGSVVLDYGKSGDGVIERNSSSKGAPYDRTFTWTDVPWKLSGYSNKTQFGNLSKSAGYYSEEFLSYRDQVEENGGEILDEEATRKDFNVDDDTTVYGGYLKDEVLIQVGDSNVIDIGKNVGGVGRHGYRIDKDNYHYGTGEFNIGGREGIVYDGEEKIQIGSNTEISGESVKFSYMPSVDGTPIVESGSNSDGEWVRWADGTQMCILPPETISYTATSNYIETWNFPKSFINEATVTLGGSPRLDNTIPPAITYSNFAITTSSVNITVRSTDDTDNIRDRSAIAVGKWY